MNRKIKYVSRDKILRDSWSILQRVVFAGVRQFEYLERPGLSYELTPCLRILHYYGYPVSTNMTKKKKKKKKKRTSLGFCVAGRTDHGNTVGSWGLWSKASISSIVISIPRCIFFLLILQSSMPHTFSPGCLFVIFLS